MVFLEPGYVRWDGQKYITDGNVKIVASVGGDLSGNYPTPTVVGIQGYPISQAVPVDGNLLSWVAADSRWEPKTLSDSEMSGITWSGDLSGSGVSPTVAKINGVSVQASPSNSQVLAAINGTTSIWTLLSNSSISSSAAIDGSKLNLTSMGATQPITTGGTVTVGFLTISGVTTAGPLITNSSGGVSQIALNLAGGSNYVTGLLPIANQAAQTMTGDVVGTTTANTLTLAGDVTGRAGSSTVISLTGSSGVINIGSVGNIITWNAATTSPGIKQTNNTTASATAATLTIQSQNATGTTSTGGDLVLTSGTGTTASGTLHLQAGAVDTATVTANQFITKKGIVRAMRRIITIISGNNQLTAADDILMVFTGLSAILPPASSAPANGQMHTVVVENVSANPSFTVTSATSNINYNGGVASNTCSPMTSGSGFSAATFVWNSIDSIWVGCPGF